VSDPLEMYLNDVFTTAANLVGVPGMSVPAGFSKEGLPIGVQLMASPFKEQILFDAAAAIEERAQLTERLPDEFK
jgi:aspartyl-tRNA(Asn)/glutamyl-tRNA(Gln) amidotransferase subunit A